MNIETRLNNLEKQMAQLIASVSRDKTYNGYDIEANRINTSKVDEKADSNADNINLNTETLETVMEEVIPTQAMTIEEVFETLDTLMTTIIPSLMGDE